MRIDLHTHSRASDGTDTPTELVRAAAATGLDVVAITDHDTAAGWAEATRAAEAAGVDVVPGMEISTEHRGRSVHLLGYLPDPTYPPLVEALDRVLDGRESRVPVLIERLRSLGIDITSDDVRRASYGTAATGRPHVADALVTIGAVADRDEAFATYLGWGKPAHIDRYAVPLVDALRLIAEAGGVSVIAHPWGRGGLALGGSERADEEALSGLQELGLAGIEVDHQDHDARARDRLRAIARNLGLVATGSSDYHGDGKNDHELGCNTTDPEQYARLLELARGASQRSGRGTPTVAG
ncbi:MAG: PHP domain-containing protein [Nocardioides sp.]|nr:PHP domain-containing protein [Nocardioides sp.]